MTRPISTSECKTYRACPRKHYLMYHMGYRPVVEPEYFHWGSLVHKALEHHFLGEPWQQCLKMAKTEYEAAKLRVIMNGYLARWEDEELTVVAVEKKFNIPLSFRGEVNKHYTLAGKMDLIAEWKGDLYLFEHKTAAVDISQGSPYWEQLKVDQQISNYYIAAKNIGYDVVGCRYDVLGKPKHRPKKAGETPQEFEDRLAEAVMENPDKYYQRGTVVRLGPEERAARQDLWQHAAMIRWSEENDAWPRNPDECLRFGRCLYFNVCSGCESIDNESVFRKAKRKHEEL